MAARAAPGNRPQYISRPPSRNRPPGAARPAAHAHKRKAPRSAGNPWPGPAGPRSWTARDRGAHRSAAAALGYPACGVATAPPECRSPLRGRHLRRARTMVFHRITSFAGRVAQAAGPNPPGRRAAQACRQPPCRARNLCLAHSWTSRAGCQLARPDGGAESVRSVTMPAASSAAMPAAGVNWRAWRQPAGEAKCRCSAGTTA